MSALKNNEAAYDYSLGDQSLSRLSSSEWAIDEYPDVLARIYDDEVSIAVWQRKLDQEISLYLDQLLRQPNKIALKLSGTPEQLLNEIKAVFPEQFNIDGKSISASGFFSDITLVLEMFCCLFDAKALGLRINVLEHAMCPRFHVDNVALRLITSYHGLATQWLPNQVANRSALGTDMASQIGGPGAITDKASHIQDMAAGDVALFKGELWEGNQGRGIIHRSPKITDEQPRRLVVTCDLIE